ncbi:DUF3467 domain-containing protein [Methylobacterium sp. NPDC080182]|uniref:DUF3467 domain-containing protein n=1 Tax=Methylobacterium sp. NPDC080182 TaxID=3390590 RepID=UPI003CFF7843
MAEQQLVRSPNFQDIYSNSTTLSISPYDATLAFARMGNFGPSRTLEELVHVRVSPQQLKYLAQNLSTAVEAWEAEFGKIETVGRKGPSLEQMRKGLSSLKPTPKPVDAEQDATKTGNK